MLESRPDGLRDFKKGLQEMKPQRWSGKRSTFIDPIEISGLIGFDMVSSYLSSGEGSLKI